LHKILKKIITFLPYYGNNSIKIIKKNFPKSVDLYSFKDYNKKRNQGYKKLSVMLELYITQLFDFDSTNGKASK